MADWFDQVQYSDSAAGLDIAKTQFGAKYLVPKGGTANYDIHGKFPWTISGNSTRALIPYITLTEYRLKYSAELLSYINSARGLKENLNRVDLTNPLSQLIAGAAAVAAAGAGARAAITNFQGVADTVANLLPGRVGARARVLVSGTRAQKAAGRQTLGTAAGAIIGGLGTAALGALAYGEANDPDTLLAHISNSRKNENFALDPYANLYRGVSTKITYTLPYISVDNMIGIESSWKEPGKEGALAKVISSSEDLLKKGGGGFTIDAAKLAMTAIEAMATAGEPGTAREKIKGYVPPDGGDTVTVTFYLFNTQGLEYIRKNWEFLYVLTYQNLPNRRSINLLDPPCIYEIDIPGYKRFPVANIEKLKVTNEGITRYVNMINGEVMNRASGDNVKIIPEAYKVTLTVRSLLTPSQNLFQWTDDSSNVVQVFNATSKDSKSPETLPVSLFKGPRLPEEINVGNTQVARNSQEYQILQNAATGSF